MNVASLPRPVRSIAGATGYVVLPRLWWLAGTRIVLNSVPKCGTHLLRRLLLLVGVPFSATEIHVNDETTQAILDELLSRSRGRAVLGHLAAAESYYSVAAKHRARVVFITRDPRDQVVSHVFHYRNHADHPLHPYFRDRVPDLDDALHAAIRGFGPGPDGHLADVDTFFRYFLGWRDAPGVHATSFERLVGPRGGGAVEHQIHEVGAVLRHLHFPLRSPGVVRFFADRVYSCQSPTFRSGRIGDWRRHFKADHVRAFKEVAGRLLIDLGYERDLAW